MFSGIVRFFWPDLTDEEIRKFSLLSVTFFFTIGTYWLLRGLKDTLFFDIVGGQWQPRAKMISVVVVSLLVIVYSKLVDMFERHKLFYILGTMYTFFFGIITYFIYLSKYAPGAVAPQTLKLVTWISYFVIESYGSIVVALFWSFVNSISDPASAKRGYSVIISGAQVGAILGPFLVWNAERVGVPLLFAIGTVAVVMLMLMIRRFMSVMPADQLVGSKQDAIAEKKPKTGFFEGLRLILTRPYLFGIFAVVTIYEVVGTIVDYQMKMQAKAIYPGQEAFGSFMGLFGMATNGLAFLMALLGTSYIMKRFSLTFCLLTFPVTLGVAVAALAVLVRSGTVEPQTLLWATFGVMIIAKGLSYALNNPSKEMMYIPTSKDAKFKSKGWIDAFGSRFSKAGGSTFNEFLKHSPVLLLNVGTVISLGLIGVWIVIAMYVGGAFKKLTDSNEIIQ